MYSSGLSKQLDVSLADSRDQAWTGSSRARGWLTAEQWDSETVVQMDSETGGAEWQSLMTLEQAQLR